MHRQVLGLAAVFYFRSQIFLTASVAPSVGLFSLMLCSLSQNSPPSVCSQRFLKYITICKMCRALVHYYTVSHCQVE